MSGHRSAKMNTDDVIIIACALYVQIKSWQTNKQVNYLGFPDSR